MATGTQSDGDLPDVLDDTCGYGTVDDIEPFHFGTISELVDTSAMTDADISALAARLQGTHHARQAQGCTLRVTRNGQPSHAQRRSRGPSPSCHEGDAAHDGFDDVEAFQFETLSELVNTAGLSDDAVAALAQRLNATRNARQQRPVQHRRMVASDAGHTLSPSHGGRGPPSAAPSSGAVSPFQGTLSDMANAASPEPMAALMKALSDHVISRKDDAAPDTADVDSLDGDR